jgi:hypothetical protein
MCGAALDLQDMQSSSVQCGSVLACMQLRSRMLVASDFRLLSSWLNLLCFVLRRRA